MESPTVMCWRKVHAGMLAAVWGVEEEEEEVLV